MFDLNNELHVLYLNPHLLLQEHDQMFDNGSKISANRQFFESDDQIFSGLLPILAPAETVTELRVGVLVKTAGSGDREISPHVFARFEVQLVDGARARLEPFVRVF